MMFWRDIVFLVAGSGLAAFFSGAETGAYVISRLRLRYRASERNERWAQRIERLLDNTPIFVTAMLIWTNIALDIVSVSCTSLYTRSSIGIEPEIAATLTAAPILFIFAELAPKTLFRQRAEQLMSSSSRALYASVYVVYPIAGTLSAMGQVVRKVLRLPPPRHWASVSRGAVHDHLAAGVEQGALSVHQQDLAINIMRAGTMRASLAAVPVDQSPAYSETSTAGELVEQASCIETPRVLVYSGHKDHIVGVIHIVQSWRAPEDQMLADLMRMPVWLDEDVSVLQALVSLKRAGKSVAILAAPAPETEGRPERDDMGGITQTIDWRARGTVTVEQLLKHLVAYSNKPRGNKTSRFFSLAD